MGVDTRKPPLPAPTESSMLNTSGSITGTDLATDVSRRTDQTSYSIPDDGSPITISTRRKRDHRDKDQESTLTRASHHSQTSLLIEYFEGGKGPNLRTRPSVRVKVTPSAARKIKDTSDHIQISETGGTRKPSYSRRISLGPKVGRDRQITETGDDRSISSYTSAAEDSNVGQRGPPVEIEVLHRDQGSDLSGASQVQGQQHTYQNTSDISSMPPDSMLDGNAGNITPRRNRSRSMSREKAFTTQDKLKTPSRRRSRSLSRERIAAQKVIEKLGSKPREVSSGKHRSGSGSKARSRNASKEHIVESVKSPRRRSSRHHHDEELTSGAESSLLTTSQLSAERKSGDQQSFRSGTSKSSINNPKLLDMVEDAVRRLILPELSALKKEQKTEHNRTKFERGSRDSIGSGNGASGEGLTRRVSKHASAPDFAGKPKVVLNRDENDPGITLSGNSVKGRKDFWRDGGSGGIPGQSYNRDMRDETLLREQEKVRRRRSKDDHRVRDAAATGLAGGVLTAAALKHHDSRSSVDSRRERRKKQGKSRSRSASLAESTEEIFYKHDVPLMPMRSEINESELTRDSILSEQTAGPHASTPGHHGAQVHEVSRGSPREVSSPASRTPTRTPVALQKGLGTHHSNHSRGDLSVRSVDSDRSHRSASDQQSKAREAGLASATAGVGVLAADHRLDYHDTLVPHEYVPREQNRALSPIQSVASYRDETSEPPDRRSRIRTHSTGSLSHSERAPTKASNLSIDSLSSAASTDLARSRRPQGFIVEEGRLVFGSDRSQPLETQYEDEPTAEGMEQWYDQQHEENERYRDSTGDSSYRDTTIDVRHLTNYTDDSLDAPYLDRVTAGQEVRGVGANPEYIHTPVAVESAVASLHDPSVLDVHSTQSGRSKGGERSYPNSLNGGHPESRDYYAGSEPGLDAVEQGSPLKQQHNAPYSAMSSPTQRTTRSLEGRQGAVRMGASGLPIADDPIPEIGHGLDSESDINTNPSIIQGPMGGLPQGSRDHWPYQPTPPQPKGNVFSGHSDHGDSNGLHTTEAGLLTAAAVAATHNRKSDIDDHGNGSEHDREVNGNYESTPAVDDEYYHGVNHDSVSNRDPFVHTKSIPTPPMAKDEGYISAANPRSPGNYTPEPLSKNARVEEEDDVDGIDYILAGEDPFLSNRHARHLSGNSHGMQSPLYDSATGKGIDRIQSKDIVALMDHLTVRDAQRNARDTEILVTLVRSAAEMRNSFEDMKRFIADQDDMIIDTADKQHERTTQKIIGGPRPQPNTGPRAPRGMSVEDEALDDLPAKRRNVFKRALKGLSMRSSNDLGKIEEMLQTLLGEVEGLKAAQGLRPNTSTQHTNSFNSYDDLHATAPEAGYEPEGHAGTGSTGNQSGYLSNSPSRHGVMRSYEGRRGSGNRVSTVLEGDEELDAHEQALLSNQFENSEQLLTPTRDYARHGSVPLNTPPQVHILTGAHSNENTPRTATDKSRKHKSSSSSFFPKISRWSKTTASSVGDNFKGGNRKERPLSEASRSHSGSLMNYDANDHYDTHDDDRLRSSYSLENGQGGSQIRPPSPLIPSHVSEDPKYQAHRNSLNLQHPQPRPGPTQRYQNHLESQAHHFDSPMSPTSDQWGSNPSLARFVPGPSKRHSGGAGYLSPISDAGYSELSAANEASAPPRPPKLRDDGPLVPQRPAKTTVKGSNAQSQLGPEHLAVPEEEQRYSSGSGYEQVNDSPLTASGQVPQRKPTGPRPINSSGNYTLDKVGTPKRQRYRGSPNAIDSTEDVTF